LLLQILKHTPTWVFALFFGLIYLGYLQSRPRQVSRARLLLLPISMAGLSVLGVWSSFAANAVAFSAWGIVAMVVIVLCLRTAAPASTFYHADSQRFFVPGSWVPLTLMMCIFFTKYAVAVARAFDPLIGSAFAPVIAICALYGLYSGLFLGRAIRTAKVAHRLPNEPTGDRDGAWRSPIDGSDLQTPRTLKH
jgi:hypothetical protein